MAKRWEQILVVALGVCAGLLAEGCGFFNTRSLVAPVGTIVVPKVDPTHPDSVMTNYQVAIRYWVTGEGQLRDTMIDEFLMTLSDADSADLDLGSFGKTLKVQAYSDLSLAAPADTFWFEFPDLGRPPDFINSEFVRYDTMRYVFQVLQRSGGTVSVFRTYSGRATLQFGEDPQSAGTWLLLDWRDFQDDSGNSTWGRYLGEGIPR